MIQDVIIKQYYTLVKDISILSLCAVTLMISGFSVPQTFSRLSQTVSYYHHDTLSSVENHIMLTPPAVTPPQGIASSHHMRKARAFNRNAALPLDPLLRQHGYIQIGTFHNLLDAEAVESWLRTMSKHGINMKKVSSNHQHSVYIRFLQEKELDMVYEKLYAYINNITGLDRCIIKHVIFKESRGRENARSHAGARGLTQTLPIVIQDLVKEKKAVGLNVENENHITHLQNDIETLLYKTSANTHHLISPSIHKEIEQKKYYINRSQTLALIPDYVISPPALSDTISYSEAEEVLPQIETLALTHGPLNLLFGMAHLALSYHALEYYKAISITDPDTESLLASQLAYNCGLSRTTKRIKSLGGWSKIFDVPPKLNGRRAAYLPSETADYGYQFIKEYMHYMVQRGQSYRLHPNEKLHYKICLRALMRSRAFHGLIEALQRKNLRSKSTLLTAEVNKLIQYAQEGTIEERHLRKLQSVMTALPNWPLAREVRIYIDTLIRNHYYFAAK